MTCPLIIVLEQSSSRSQCKRSCVYVIIGIAKGSSNRNYAASVFLLSETNKV